MKTALPALLSIMSKSNSQLKNDGTNQSLEVCSWEALLIANIPALLQPVVHALLQGEEVNEMLIIFPEHHLRSRQARCQWPVGSLLRHLKGVLDRLFHLRQNKPLTWKSVVLSSLVGTWKKAAAYKWFNHLMKAVDGWRIWSQKRKHCRNIIGRTSSIYQYWPFCFMCCWAYLWGMWTDVCDGKGYCWCVVLSNQFLSL